MKQNPYKIYLLGSGNVASHLGRILVKSGYIIAGIFSRNRQTGNALAAEFNTEFTDEIKNIPAQADIYILAVKDDAIARIAEVLHLPGKIVVHTSGTVEAASLEKISEKFGVFYPLQSFTKSHFIDWARLPVCIEGNSTEVENILQEITKNILATPFFVNSFKRRRLHLAAVWVNNFSNYLLQVAESICKKNEIPFHILEPLANETIRKAFTEGPFLSQSGPALRGDAGTLSKHLSMLENDENNKLLYIMLSKAIRETHNVHQHISEKNAED